MINMIQNAKDQVAAVVEQAYKTAVEHGQLSAAESEIHGNVEVPKDTRNGDYTSNFALAGAKALKMRPRDLAQLLVDNLVLDGTYFSKVEIAGPGFLNFTVNDKWYGEVLSAVESEGMDYGTSDMGHGERVMVEFVSANPTGPMTIGNARGGVLGDTLASVLKKTGHNVWREFYVNDAGNQVDKFGRSIEVRYLQILHGVR